jgi:toxin HigB-1
VRTGGSNPRGDANFNAVNARECRRGARARPAPAARRRVFSGALPCAQWVQSILRYIEYRYVPRFVNIEAVARRKLGQLDAAHLLQDLASPPGNRLEALDRDRKGQHSIRINGQWRVCFVWTPQGPTNVEIVDYH